MSDSTNKLDVGSTPGTMWSLSSQKPGHGIAELRDDDTTKLWQSDGVLPHLISIQFAQRTAVTHVSLYLDYRLDDSYTPIKIRVMAGTHHHDLVEVRTRDFEQPVGWKHFVLDKFDSRGESEESDSDSSDSTLSGAGSDAAADSHELTSKGTSRFPSLLGYRPSGSKDRQQRSSPILTCGVSKKHPPIYTYLVQICILANHAVGKDTHVRGIKVFGPPTIESREKAKRDAKKSRESRRITGSRAVRLSEERKVKRKKHARDTLVSWLQHEGAEMEGDGHDSSTEEEHGHSLVDVDTSRRLRIPTSRNLDLLSTLR